MNQDNRHFKNLFGPLIIATMIMPVVIRCTTGDSGPAKKPAGELGRIAAETTNCETAGPLKLTPDAHGVYALETLSPRADLFCAIVVPIEGTSLELIASGSQIYDYRRGFPTDKISHVVFFNTTLREISVIAEVAETLAGGADEITNLTWETAGRNFDEARSFFSGQPFGFAVKLRNVRELVKPITLSEARTLDVKFQRPFGYLFLERHPAVSAEIQHRLPALDDMPPAI